jgi:hypothetical protein
MVSRSGERYPLENSIGPSRISADVRLKSAKQAKGDIAGRLDYPKDSGRSYQPDVVAVPFRGGSHRTCEVSRCRQNGASGEGRS